MISSKSISENEIKESASNRLRQDLPSGTYDRFGRPTLKPVFSDINASLRPKTCSSTSLLSGADKRRSSLNLSVRQKRPSKSFLPMDSFPVDSSSKPASPVASKIRSVTTQTTDNAIQNQPALTSETLFAFDIHEKKKSDVNSSQETRKSISEIVKRPRSSVNISIPTAKSYATTTSISSDKKTENYSDDDFSSIASPRSERSSHVDHNPVTKSITEFHQTEPMSEDSPASTPRAQSSYRSKSSKTATENEETTDYSTDDFESPRPQSDKTIPSAPVRSKSPVIGNRRQRR